MSYPAAERMCFSKACKTRGDCAAWGHAPGAIVRCAYPGQMIFIGAPDPQAARDRELLWENT